MVVSMAMRSAILCGCALLASCNCQVSAGSSGMKIAPTGPETWTIDGKAYHVDSTYMLRVKEGLQFTIEWSCPECASRIDGISDEEAFRLARPLMRYAVAQGFHGRKHVQMNGRQLQTWGIGVAITVHTGGGAVKRARGYRVSRSLADIAAAAP